MSTRLPSTVVDELTGLRAAGGPTGAVHDVVESLFEQAQQDLTRRALLTLSLEVGLVELLLEHAVDVLRLLLLLHLGEVLATGVAATGTPVLAGREGTALERLATLFVFEDVDRQAARDAHLGSGVTSHDSVLLLNRADASAGGTRCEERV